MQRQPSILSQPGFQGINPYGDQVIVHGVSADVLGLFHAAQALSIRQHIKLLPKAWFTCPPCVQQENTYSIYAGLSRDSMNEFLRVDEVSDDWNRCCCKPYHPLKLEVRQYIPDPGETSINSDSGHFNSDISRDYHSLSAGRKQEFMRNMYMRNPVLFTIIRDDGVRCCYKWPCKCLSCFVCCNSCADGAHIYAGELTDPEGNEKGRPYYSPRDRQLGSVIQPKWGGGCTPTLHLRYGSVPDDSEPFAKIEGPCCFGGWSELCFDFNFFTSAYQSPTKTGDLAMIVKRHPSTMAMVASDLMSNADNYTIEFNPDISLTPGEKATILAGQLLADYMFFDGNTEKCKSEDNTTTCYFFYCSILGCVVPCQFSLRSGGK